MTKNSEDSGYVETTENLPLSPAGVSEQGPHLPCSNIFPTFVTDVTREYIHETTWIDSEDWKKCRSTNRRALLMRSCRQPHFETLSQPPDRNFPRALLDNYLIVILSFWMALIACPHCGNGIKLAWRLGAFITGR